MPSSSNVLRRAALLLQIVMLGAAGAASSATVVVGGETKQSEGILREAQSGDIACYLTLETTGGETFYESATFEICEDAALIGQRLKLGYSVENVLAAECEGDVDCGKSDQVVLVNSVQALGVAPAAVRKSFCTDSETVVFACRTGAKLVSVCASEDQSTLQYRFGALDGTAKPEMILPKNAAAPADAASGASVPFSGGGGVWLKFRNGDYAYVVYSGIGRWGVNGETIEKEGVVVERKGELVKNFPCTGPLTSELGPEWFEQLGITDNEEWFDFPE